MLVHSILPVVTGKNFLDLAQTLGFSGSLCATCVHSSALGDSSISLSSRLRVKNRVVEKLNAFHQARHSTKIGLANIIEAQLGA